MRRKKKKKTKKLDEKENGARNKAERRRMKIDKNERDHAVGGKEQRGRKNVTVGYQE